MSSPVFSASLFWLAAATCLVAQIAVLRAALAGRTPGATSTRGARVRELFWVILPAVALGFVLVWTWRTLPSRRTAEVPARGSNGTLAAAAPASAESAP